MLRRSRSWRSPESVIGPLRPSHSWGDFAAGCFLRDAEITINGVCSVGHEGDDAGTVALADDGEDGSVEVDHVGGHADRLPRSYPGRPQQSEHRLVAAGLEVEVPAFVGGGLVVTRASWLAVHTLAAAGFDQLREVVVANDGGRHLGDLRRAHLRHRVDRRSRPRPRPIGRTAAATGNAWRRLRHSVPCRTRMARNASTSDRAGVEDVGTVDVAGEEFGVSQVRLDRSR